MAKRRRKKRSDWKFVVAVWSIFVVFMIAIYVTAWIYADPTEALTVGLFLLLILCAYMIWRYQRRKKRIEVQRFHAKNLGELLVLTPSEFEHAIGSLLSGLGYRDVVVSGKAGDLMADITCRDTQGRLVVCQCKRYSPGHSVGTPEVQAFIGMRHAHFGAAEGIFVTTSRFTNPARALAKKHHITLMDGETLTSYMGQFSSGQRRDL